MPCIQENQHQMTNIPEIEYWMAHLKTLCDCAQVTIWQAQTITQKYTEQKKGQHHFRPFTEGQQVWLEGTNLCLSHPTAKLCPKRFGLFHITKVISPCVYHIQLPPHWKIHDVLSWFAGTNARSEPLNWNKSTWGIIDLDGSKYYS